MKNAANKRAPVVTAAIFAGSLLAAGAVYYAYTALRPAPVQEVPEIIFARHGDRQELTERYALGKAEADSDWEEKQGAARPLEGLGATDRLEILPLVEMRAAGEELLTEPGVSYLLRTGDTTILFDVGFNHESNDSSPLVRNMLKLGVKKEEIKVLFISHPHRDHVGGRQWEEKGTFSFGPGQTPLPGVKIYTPVPLSYPGAKPVLTENPAVIADGVASVGAIKSFDFFTGMISEAALAVNVRGKGIVLVTGCGHQGLERLLARAKKLFREPIYAVVGGLHYPVSGSRLNIRGVEVQKYFGTGRLPWVPVTIRDVRMGIKALKAEKVKLVAVSPHDSCDETLAEFRKAFPGAYRDIEVGSPIRIE
jgi:7,8-dihydropterin-6-yl-methyl-4-(beta-D-ribofuranosyl)aminobenzene 5'-phosphate synthase